MKSIEMDGDYEDTTIAEVRPQKGGWEIKRADGWLFWISEDGGVEPKVGMAARFYGKGIGFGVRGVSLDGQVLYYRTPEEDKDYQDRMMYGEDAAEWLKRWDEGRSVWSIEMGGLGPGYEQAIQVTAAEILRFVLEKKYDFAQWDKTEVFERARDEIRAMGETNAIVRAMGLSGAQWGAACNIALQIAQRGPITVMTDERVKDRHIQVSRSFPSVPALANSQGAGWDE